MFIESFRAAALLTRIATGTVGPPEDIIQHPIDACTRTDNRIYCPRFRIERTTPHANAVDVIPHVYNWRNVAQWVGAFKDGWDDGLDYIYKKGCEVEDVDKNYTNAHMTVFLRDARCLGYE